MAEEERTRKSDSESDYDDDEGEEEEEEHYADVSCGVLERSSAPDVDFSPCAMPSKAGGKPVWLALDGLPTAGMLACPSCHVPMVFLLQLQSSIARPDDDAFYRAVYVFCCKSCNRYTALRCQLPDRNPYYQPECTGTAEAPSPLKPTAPREATCQVCGCAGTKTCSRCHAAHYCCEHHQLLAWRGGHAKVCGRSTPPAGAAAGEQGIDDQGLKFPEYVIASVDEPDHDEPDPALDRRIRELEERCARASQAAEQADTNDDDSDEQHVAVAAAVDLDFVRFQKRLHRVPEQVVRYLHGNVGLEFGEDKDAGLLEPLWCSREGVPAKEEIPCCENCGAERVPEFQVMPQIIALLGVPLHSGMDFGTLVVYTCSRSCAEHKEAKTHYLKEFVWTQMPAKAQAEASSSTK